MITYHIHASLSVSDRFVSIPGWNRTFNARLHYADDEDDRTFTWEHDQDFIITKYPDPELKAPANIHDCVHEKLSGHISGTADISVLPWGGVKPDFVINAEGSSDYTYKFDYNDHPATNHISVTATTEMLSLNVAMTSYSFVSTCRYWHAGQWWTDTHVSTTMRVTCGVMRVSVLPDSWSEEVCKSYFASLLTKWGLGDLSEGPRFREMVYRKADEIVHPGAIAAKAAASIRRLDINTLQYVKDIVEIPALGSGLVELGSDFAEYITQHPKKAEKAADQAKRFAKHVASTASKAYLTSHYGIKLTIQDTQEIASAIEDTDFTQPDQTLGGYEEVEVDLPAWGTTCVVGTRVTAVVGSYDDKQLKTCESIKESTNQLTNMVKRAGYELDVLPTTANMWDMVPLSFVVDWFLPIGDYFEKVEARNYMATLPLKRCFITRTVDYDQVVDEDIPLTIGTYFDTLKVTGLVRHHIYERNYSPILPTPPLGSNNTGEGGAFNHVVEASALLVSFTS